jgi:hypothetical protein
MKNAIRGGLAAVLFGIAALPSGAQAATNNFLVVMDVSNSMWGQIGGRPKIDIARDAFNSILDELDEKTSVGLMAYGHRRKDDCQDVELLVPIAPEGKAAARAAMAKLQPTGKTPIAYSLGQTLPAFEGKLEDNNNVLLISDGIETCEGKPCQVAAELKQKGVNLRVHVVGFDVDDAAREQLGCIAREGGGEYYDAGNADELTEVLQEVRVVAEAETVATDAQVAQAMPAEPEMEEVFFDDFDSDTGDVGPEWIVNNPDPDAYIVEDGELLIVNSQSKPMNEVGNLMLLDVPFPKGDWTVTVRLKGEFQTAHEDMFMGIYDNETSYMIASLQAYVCGNWGNFACGSLAAVKQTAKDQSSFSQLFWQERFDVDGYDFSTRMREYPSPILLRLRKEGRNYTFGFKVEGYEDVGKQEGKEAYNVPPYTDWYDMESFKLLRLRGKIALGINQRERADGESAVKFDWVKIEQPKQ